MSLTRLILPVFGEVAIPSIVGKIALLPEVQRLRHVSLSNIDSCSLTAIGGVSRFEHSLGTAILAWKLSQKLGLDDDFASELILAAGLHDIAAPGLGHLFEEGCKLAGQHFDHESKLRKMVFEEGEEYLQTYLGKELGCRKLMSDLNVQPKSVFDAIAGEGRCKTAINGSMDLDNIDNVARMLSRLGTVVPYEKVLNFIDFFCISNGAISVNPNKMYLFNEWLELRKKLYNMLMPEPTDFAAKSMTKLAIATGIKKNVVHIDDWHLTDYEILHKLLAHESTKELVQRLLLGKYYRIIGMYWIEGEESIRILQNNSEREELQCQANKYFGKGIFIDYIRDKRGRTIDGPHPPVKALLGVISQYSTPAKQEVKLCDKFIRAHFNVSEKVSLYTRSLSVEKSFQHNQSQLSFADM